MCQGSKPMATGESAITVETSRLVSVRTASDRTGIPRRTLYQWIAQKKIASVSIDGIIFLHDEDVRRLAA